MGRSGDRSSRVSEARTRLPLSSVVASGREDYVAALVPAWRIQVASDGSDILLDSWDGGTASVTVACFDSWTFRTTVDAGDFAAVSSRLDPLTPAETAVLQANQFGRAHVDVRLQVGGAPLPGLPLAGGGALAVIADLDQPPVTDPLLPPGTGWMQGAAGIAATLFGASRLAADNDATSLARLDNWWALR